MDKEIEAIRKVLEILYPFERSARKRIVDYADMWVKNRKTEPKIEESAVHGGAHGDKTCLASNSKTG